MVRRSVTDRFHAKTMPDLNSDCLLWTANKTYQGYGRFMLHGTVQAAHRVAYELINGPIPDNLCVLHRCDNPSCVNPQHLFLGTRLDNNRDKIQKGRNHRKITPEQVQEIRNNTTESSKTLANKYGVCRDHINAIKSRIYWKNI